MPYARLDRRVIMRLVADLLLAETGLLVYMVGEQPPEEPTLPIAQILAIGYEPDRTAGGSETPDDAQITITINVWLKRALYALDAFALETAVSQVANALSHIESNEGDHQIITQGAAIDFDTAPDPAAHARSAGVTIIGTAQRLTGATLE